MRKWLSILLVLLLVSLLPASVLAAQEDLTVNNAKASPGDTVYLTLTLNRKVTGDAMGVEFTYDKAVLELIPSACQWKPAGILQDMGSLGDSGVWTALEPASLEGPVCVLAFAVKKDAEFSQTQVSCTLKVKNGSQLAGEFQTAAEISRHCAHTYGQWEGQGDTLHARKCSLCGQVQNGSHEWGEPVRSAHPQDPYKSLETTTCGLCGQERVQQINEPFEDKDAGAEGPENDFSAPTGYTKPSDQEELPPRPTNNPNDGSLTPPTSEPQGDHDHSHGDSFVEIPSPEEDPHSIPGHTHAPQEDIHSVPGHTHAPQEDLSSIPGHTHAAQEEAHDHRSPDPLPVLIALGVVGAVLIGGCLYFVKRKH